MQSKRLNILISAHELNPYGGSECAEGWNVVTGLAKYHNITVLHASGSQFNAHSYEDAINDYFSKNENIYNINFISIGQTKFTKLLSTINKRINSHRGSIGSPFLYYYGYSLWQKKAYLVAKDLCKKSKFDVVHHLTSISFREPGLLWKLGIPFVWGPTGGLSKIPFEFYNLIGYKAYSKEFVRNCINYIQFYSNVRINMALKRSDIIYTFSKEDKNLFFKRTGKSPKVLLDAATFIINSEDPVPSNQSLPLNAVWCGELIKRKSLEIVLYAINSDQLLKKNIKLRIIGGGPLMQYYKLLSTELGIEECIEWMGKVDRKTVFNTMAKSDVLIHSSYREGTAHVITESLSHGLPVICHDINGLSIAINENCGIKIPLISPKNSITGFKNALVSLINNPAELKKLKIGAINRAKELTWDKMVETISNDYFNIYQKSESL